jgi:hypothetical protein
VEATGRLPFLPSLDGATSVNEAIADAETAEFKAGSLDIAIERYRVLARHTDPSLRAGALVRLARVLRKRGDTEGALAAAAALVALGSQDADGIPAALAGLDAQRLALSLRGETDDARRVAEDIRQRLGRAGCVGRAGSPSPAVRSFRGLKTVGWRGPLKMFFSPDGKYLAYDLPSSDTNPNRDVLVMAVDGSREATVVDHAAQDVVMGWSRDGSRLLFASDRSGVIGLWSVPVAGGRAAGEPTLVKKEIGSITSIGLTAGGALHVVKDSSTLSLQIAPIDIAAGRLTGPGVLENFRSLRPSWSRDGKRIAYGYTGLNGARGIAVREVGSSKLRELPLPLEYLIEPDWLPDGQSLVVFARDFKGKGGIHRVDVASGRSSLIADADQCRVKVSLDGRKIYYQVGPHTLGPGEPLRLVERDLTTGETREIGAGDGSLAREPSPDGRIFAAIVPQEDEKRSTLVLTPVGTGEPVRRFQLPRLFGTRQPSWLPDGSGVLAREMYGDRALWIVPLDGSPHRRLDIDTREWVTGAGIRLQPDGTHIAHYIGKEAREVWALEGVAQR